MVVGRTCVPTDQTLRAVISAVSDTVIVVIIVFYSVISTSIFIVVSGLLIRGPTGLTVSETALRVTVISRVEETVIIIVSVLVATCSITVKVT
jgi:capsule polysaccharide export protein KpsE/RkpR